MSPRFYVLSDRAYTLAFDARSAVEVRMTREQLIAMFQRRDRHWQNRDVPALVADHAENGVAVSPMLGRLEGRERIRAVYESWFAAFPDLKLTIDELLVDGDRVVQFVTITGTQTGPFGGLRPTGRKFQITGAWLYTLDESGRITHDRRVYDVTTMLVQIGALRAKPAD